MRGGIFIAGSGSQLKDVTSGVTEQVTTLWSLLLAELIRILESHGADLELTAKMSRGEFWETGNYKYWEGCRGW